MKLISNNFKRIDYFGHEFNFELDNSQIYRTNKGACISLICFLIVFIIALMNGTEIYQRKNPITTESSELNLDSKIYLKNTLIFFNLENYYGKKYKNIEEYFDVNVKEISINEYSKAKLTRTSLVNCLNVEFSPLNDRVMKDSITKENINASCFNFDQNSVIMNQFPNQSSNILSASFNLCDINDTEREIPCKINEKFFLGLPFLVIRLGAHYIDNIDYHNPVKHHLIKKTLSISKGLFKRDYFYFSVNEYKDDLGWIIQKDNVMEFSTYSAFEEQIDENLNGKLVANISISGKYERNKYIRRYMKIQDLFAKIGGVANGLFILIKLLSNNYLRFLYLVFIRDNTIKYLGAKYEVLEKLNRKAKLSSNIYINNINDNNKKRNNWIVESSLNNTNLINLRDKRNQYSLNDSHVPKVVKFENKMTNNNKENKENDFYINYFKEQISPIDSYKPILKYSTNINSPQKLNYSNANNEFSKLDSNIKYKNNKDCSDVCMIRNMDNLNSNSNKIVVSQLNSNIKDNSSQISENITKNIIEKDINIKECLPAQNSSINNQEKYINKMNKYLNNNLAYKTSNVSKIPNSKFENDFNPINIYSKIKYTYFMYIKSILCFCCFRDIRKTINLEFGMIKNILDVRKFNRHLTKEYYLRNKENSFYNENKYT